jgi:hypothetical protein
MGLPFIKKCVLAGVCLGGALVAPGLALASERACLLEGDFTMGGQRVVINDCAENRNMPAAQFREACQWMGNPMNDNRYRARITYMASCPANPQARCENAMGGSMNFAYYLRDRELLQNSRGGCESMGGRWVQ